MEAVAFDWDKPETFGPALQGVEKLFLLTPVSDKQVEYTKALVDAAKRAGVKHIVKLSVIGVDAEPGISWIDGRDVGEVAAAVLTSSGHEGKAYVLTGSEALGDAEALAILGEAVGRKYTYVDVPDEAAHKAMSDMGMPGWMVTGLMELNGLLKSGGAPGVAPGVKQVLGREPRTFKQYAQDYAAGAR